MKLKGNKMLNTWSQSEIQEASSILPMPGVTETVRGQERGSDQL